MSRGFWRRWTTPEPDISVHDDGRVASRDGRGSAYPVHKAHKADTAGYGGPQGRVEKRSARTSATSPTI